MQIFNGDKDLVFGGSGIKGKGNLGNAGWDNKTISLNESALDVGNDTTLGKFTSIMTKEGAIIDYNILKGNTKEKEEAMLKSGDEEQIKAVYADRFTREQFSYQVTEMTMNQMENNLGIKIEDKDYKERVGLAAQGKFEEAGLEWKTGQDANLITMDKDTKYFDHYFNRGTLGFIDSYFHYGTITLRSFQNAKGVEDNVKFLKERLTNRSVSENYKAEQNKKLNDVDENGTDIFITDRGNVPEVLKIYDNNSLDMVVLNNHESGWFGSSERKNNAKLLVNKVKDNSIILFAGCENDKGVLDSGNKQNAKNTIDQMIEQKKDGIIVASPYQTNLYLDKSVNTEKIYEDHTRGYNIKNSQVIKEQPWNVYIVNKGKVESKKMNTGELVPYLFYQYTWNLIKNNKG